MEETPNNQLHERRKKIALVLFPLIIILGGLAFFFYIRYKATHISTDDAFVDGRVHVIAPKVSGTVKILQVKDNQLVEKNDLLLELDPIDYDVRVEEAAAGLEAEKMKLTEIQHKTETARTQLAEAMAALDASRANLALQQANLLLAKKDFKRAEMVEKDALISQQDYDRSKTAVVVSLAHVKSAQDTIKQFEAGVATRQAVLQQTESSITTQKAIIRQKEASLKQAKLNQTYTGIYAPCRGYITKRSVEVGNQVQVGQPLMALVPLDSKNIWITANYKETELAGVKPGQKVKVKVDTYHNKVFYGKVESIMAGTGAIFSLFPPENATGNYVKIVQRIPVKIVLDENTDPEHLLRIGMSVVPTIIVKP